MEGPNIFRPTRRFKLSLRNAMGPICTPESSEKRRPDVRLTHRPIFPRFDADVGRELFLRFVSVRLLFLLFTRSSPHFYFASPHASVSPLAGH
ncbi:hypothetical protein E2C01_057281 [Portunus trituberculatus]|uniref:Uncharacterized protein n=1 Tax=Portunus trituberculatus TaxID=210409 RepID=A0A5B7H1G0_PORTR|nr:hypothetical protein [Portunus trituberculatus]